MTMKELEIEALAMGVNERAELAHKLLRSLEELSESEIDALWIEESLRRDAEFDARTAKARDAEDVFRDARNRFSI